MTEQELKQRIDAVRAAYNELSERVASLTESAQPIRPDNAIGRLSRMDAIVNKSVDDFALQNARAQLDALQFWIDRIDTPEFGCCVRCGQPIPLKRFLYMPSSHRCVKCH